MENNEVFRTKQELIPNNTYKKTLDNHHKPNALQAIQYDRHLHSGEYNNMGWMFPFTFHLSLRVHNNTGIICNWTKEPSQKKVELRMNLQYMIKRSDHSRYFTKFINREKCLIRNVGSKWSRCEHYMHQDTCNDRHDQFPRFVKCRTSSSAISF